MKMRLKIDYTITGQVAAFIERDLLMKYMLYVIMGGKKYEKPEGDDKEIQSYYYFVSNNRMKLTEVMMKNGTHVFLKDGMLHSYDTYCYNNPLFNLKYYAINGRILSNEETVFFIRGLKVKHLKEITNDTTK